MYSDKFIATIKCNNDILRERGNEVFVPFGNEYSIFLKNLESKNALVTITIDGKDIGSSLIVNAGESLCVERFVSNNEQGNRFKFIHKNQDIVKHRGDRIDDGIVRIEFTFEKEKEKENVPYYYHTDHKFLCPYNFSGEVTYNAPGVKVRETDFSAYNSISITTASSYGPTTSSCSSKDKGGICTPNLTRNIKADEGITVKGSISFQKFIEACIGDLEDNSHSIVLILKGYIKEQQVVKPVLVRTNLQCETCGKISKSDAQYCKFCGTFLV